MLHISIDKFRQGELLTSFLQSSSVKKIFIKKIASIFERMVFKMYLIWCCFYRLKYFLKNTG
jgi:hypothetical protein